MGTLQVIKIKMLTTVRPELRFLARPGKILCEGEEYVAKANTRGAVSGLCANGEYLGVKPGEFVFVQAPDWLINIWAKEYPATVAEVRRTKDEI